MLVKFNTEYVHEKAKEATEYYWNRREHIQCYGTQFQGWGSDTFDYNEELLYWHCKKLIVMTTVKSKSVFLDYNDMIALRLIEY